MSDEKKESDKPEDSAKQKKAGAQKASGKKKTKRTTSRLPAGSEKQQTGVEKKAELINPVAPDIKALREKEPITEPDNEKVSAKKTDPVGAPLFNAKPAPRLNSKNRSKSNTWLPVISGIIALVALSGVAWSVYQQMQIKQQWKQLQSQLDDQRKVQNDQLMTNQQTAKQSALLSQVNQQNANQQAQLLAQIKQSLTATQQRVKQLSGRQQQDWLLAEAEYLINLAELKLALEKDRNTAIALLKTADQRVAQIGDTELLELRQVIAEDISALELITPVDLGGITAQLQAISTQIPQLDLVALDFEAPTAETKSPENEQKDFSWGQLYQDFLDDFVTIKDHSEPVKPLMTVEQRANLNANIQLALQQAQVGLVRADQDFYRGNLASAINWLDQFFLHNELSGQVREQLVQLQQLNITSQLPSSLGAGQTILAINQQRLYQWLTPPQSKDAAATQDGEQNNGEDKAIADDVEPTP